MGLIARLEDFNQRHPWSHNDHFGRWVTRQVAASGAHDVLDVGCGTGNLIDRLRHHATVTGLEPDPVCVARAAGRFAGDPAVTVQHAGFADRNPGRHWDAIVLVAVLHHLSLTETLRGLREALRPGGRRVVIGCHRESGPADTAVGLASLLANPIVGILAHPRRAVTLPARA